MTMEINTLLLFFLIISLPILFSAIQIKNRKRNTRLPPGPPGLPLIGNLHQLVEPLHEHFSKLSKKHGPLLYLKLGSRPVLVACSSKMAEEITRKQDLNFCSRPNMVALTRLSYDNKDIAFTPYSEYWRDMRKTCVLHLLSSKRVQSFAPIREDEVSRMIQKISQEVEASDVVNLTDSIMFLTSTIICRVAFGKRYEQGSGESSHFNDMMDEFVAMMSAFFLTDFIPWLGWVDKLMGRFDRLEKIFKVMDSFYQQLIDEHLHPDRPNLSTDCDVIDILLQLMREESSSGSFSFSLDHTKAVLMNVYGASTDTIATTIIWVMTALIKNPSAVRKAQAEIRASLSLKDRRMVLEEDVTAARLPYLNAVIKEVMRMYPTLPLLVPRETINKCTIGGYEIPAKTMVHVNVWAISRDPEMWDDPDEFVPDRFLSNDDNVNDDVGRKFGNMDLKGQRDFSYIPFGAGRRVCPGITMALATVEIVVANLLYLFDWQLPDGMKEKDVDSDILPGLGMRKKNPLCLVAKKFV